MGTCHVPPFPSYPALTLDFSFLHFSFPFRAHTGDTTMASGFFVSTSGVEAGRAESRTAPPPPHQMLTHSLPCTHSRTHAQAEGLPLPQGRWTGLASEQMRNALVSGGMRHGHGYASRLQSFPSLQPLLPSAKENLGLRVASRAGCPWPLLCPVPKGRWRCLYVCVHMHIDLRVYI